MGRRFILITGRTTKQGRALHLGKGAQKYIDEVSFLEMNAADMDLLRLEEGDPVRLTSPHGTTVLRCRKSAIPSGLVFAAYSIFVNSLVWADTQGTGMPDSKGFEIEVERDAGN